MRAADVHRYPHALKLNSYKTASRWLLCLRICRRGFCHTCLFGAHVLLVFGIYAWARAVHLLARETRKPDASRFRRLPLRPLHRSQSDLKMASPTPYDKKYNKKDFMLDEAKPAIKKLISNYLKRLGPKKANEATRREICQNILTNDMWQMYEQHTNTGGDDKEKRHEWRMWMDTIQRGICEDLSAGKDTTTANGMHAPRVVSGGAADGTGMPAQSQLSKMFAHLQNTADELRKASDHMDVVVEQCYRSMLSLRHNHVQVCGLISDLQMQLRKAIDAQDVGAPAMTQMPAPAPSSTASAEAAAAGAAMQTLSDAKVSAPSSDSLALGQVGVPVYALASRRTDASAGASSRAKAAPKTTVRDHTKRVADIYEEMMRVFCVKYHDYNEEMYSQSTKEKHVRQYCQKFLSHNMTQLMAQDQNRTTMTWHSVFWLSLLYKFDDQVNEYMAQHPPAYEIKTEKQKIEQRADACKSIFIAATEGFQSKWEIKGSPGGKEDTFEKEIQHISSAFVRLGIACDASTIERPVAAETPTRKKKHGSVDGDGAQASGKNGFDEQPAQNQTVKREKNSNGDITEAEESDQELVWLSD